MFCRKLSYMIYHIVHRQVAEYRVVTSPSSDLWRMSHRETQSSTGTFIRCKLILPAHILLQSLLVELLTDALSEITYDASLAGLNYSVSSQMTGLYIAFGGYNDKLPVLINTVIEKLKTFTIDPARLTIMTEKVRISDWRLTRFCR